MKQNERDKITSMYEHYNYRCFVTGNRATQRAHIIGNTKRHINKFGKDIVDSIFNWLPCDSLKSNSLIDLGINSLEKENVAMIIQSNLLDSNKRHLIEEIVRLNIERKESKIEE